MSGLFIDCFTVSVYSCVYTHSNKSLGSTRVYLHIGTQQKDRKKLKALATDVVKKKQTKKQSNTAAAKSCFFWQHCHFTFSHPKANFIYYRADNFKLLFFMHLNLLLLVTMY